MEERLLINALKNKDEKAFEELVYAYENTVFNACLSFVKNYEDAEDLAQEVFVEVYKSIKSFKEESTLKTWIYRIAVTKSLDFLRKAKAKKRFAFFTSLTGLSNADDLSVNYRHPGVKAEDKEKSIILFKAIDSLPESQKAAFTMSKIDGLSGEETAEVLMTSVSAVQSLVHRAKQNLQKYLEKYYKNEL